MALSRAAILPTPIDPFICLLWLDVSKNTWINEVDKLYVLLNGDTEKPIVEFIKRKFEETPNIEVEYINGMIQHGTGLANQTKKAKEDLVMWIEDDGFIFRRGLVSQMFDKIERGECDVIGSPRTSSSMDIQRYVGEKYGVPIEGHGDVGVSLWPNFFFAKRSDLLKTDMDFNAKQWDRGNYIKEIDWTVTPDDPNSSVVRSDTFVWGSIQLRALGLKILHVPQYHLHPDWETQFKNKTDVFDGHAGWMHAGSLSGSIYGVLLDDNGTELAFRSLGREPKPAGWKLPDYVHTEMEKKEFERRCCFYLMAYERYKNIPELEDFGNQYKKAIDRMIFQYELSLDRIEQQKTLYLNLFKQNGAL